MTSSSTAKPRPLSPHLGIYKPQMSTVMSIFHRATGCALAFGMIMLIAWVVFLAGGTDMYAYFTGNLQTALGQIAAFGLFFIVLWYALNTALSATVRSSLTIQCVLGFLAFLASLAIAIIAHYFIVARYGDPLDKYFVYAGTAVLVGISWSFFFHFFCGIRHMIWDAGFLLNIRGMHITGWITILLSLLPTAAIWLKVWGYIQ